MLPTELSTDLTSLNENEDRAAVVVEFQVNAGGVFEQTKIYRALVRNHAQLAYSKVGPWLEQNAGPSPILQQQLKLQDEAAQALHSQRVYLGSLEFDRIEADPVVIDGKVQGIRSAERNRATDLIEDFMIAANETMARTLKEAKRSSIRRVVKAPERWPRIVDLVRQHGTMLPEEPDSSALNVFLQTQRANDPVHYPDLSLAIIKLMGPGEYVLSKAGESGQTGHFGLAALDYTHSTAPNRRFADLVTQRILKAMLADAPPPYTDDELLEIAQHCTERESAARKVERAMQKRVAAVALSGSIGKSFHGVITGANEKGVYVRIFNPPVEGKVIRGDRGLGRRRYRQRRVASHRPGARIHRFLAAPSDLAVSGDMTCWASLGMKMRCAGHLPSPILRTKQPREGWGHPRFVAVLRSLFQRDPGALTRMAAERAIFRVEEFSTVSF